MLVSSLPNFSASFVCANSNIADAPSSVTSFQNMLISANQTGFLTLFVMDTGWYCICSLIQCFSLHFSHSLARRLCSHWRSQRQLACTEAQGKRKLCWTNLLGIIKEKMTNQSLLRAGCKLGNHFDCNKEQCQIFREQTLSHWTISHLFKRKLARDMKYQTPKKTVNP